jgi:hypothetical protein
VFLIALSFTCFFGFWALLAAIPVAGLVGRILWHCGCRPLNFASKWPVYGWMGLLAAAYFLGGAGALGHYFVSSTRPLERSTMPLWIILPVAILPLVFWFKVGPLFGAGEGPTGPAAGVTGGPSTSQRVERRRRRKQERQAK